MTSLRTCLLVTVALLLTGCCCGQPEAGLRILARATAPSPTYVAMKLTPLERDEDGSEQVLIESLVVSAPRGSALPSLFDGSLDEAAAAILRDVPGATILQKPSVVTRVGESATIEVAQDDGGEVRLDHLTIDVEVARTGAPGALEVTYFRTHAGERVFSIPRRKIEVPPGKTVVLRAAAATP